MSMADSKMTLHVEYSWPWECTNLFAWLCHSYRLNEISGGYERLGQYREKGTRFLGIDFIWKKAEVTQ